MKIQTLFLHAFGPFTGAVLDFTGSTQLHLIYGANEAGKTSALRAMADLRYGIPGQSTDSFVHAYGEMSLAGTFIDAAGQPLGLARRKGNKGTLLLACPDTGTPIAGSSATPAMEQALTGGVTRVQFETLYGLDAKRLREGGQLLIQGEGELGAALFEASTGTAGIQAMLATLANDAKHYYAVGGKNMLLNEAARQLDEAQQRYKKAITRPDHWKQLERAHQTAQQQLAELQAQLRRQRQRLAQLTELRAVEPLLRDLDDATRDWQQVQSYVALAPDARERRLAAQAQAQRAQDGLQAADAALQQCQQDLQGLRTEPLLLAHSIAIERLQADAAQVRRTRSDLARLQASTHAEAEQLRAQAERLGLPRHAADSLPTLSAQLPCADEYSAAEKALEQLQDAQSNLHHASDRQSELAQRQQQLQHQAQSTVPAALQQALSHALQRAQALADAPQRCADLLRASTADESKLLRMLKKMDLASADLLQSIGYLSSAAIDAHEQAQTDGQQAAALYQDKMQTLAKDLAEQQRRLTGLGAAGEVVTAATLQQARTLRSQSWSSVRAACIDALESVDLAARTALAQSFEHAQHEADRQADLLREGAQRAAQITECEQRIAQMQQAQQALTASEAQRQTAAAAGEARWLQTLAQAAIPAGSAAEVREWLQLHRSALEQQERWQQTQDEHAALQSKIDFAQTTLSVALRDLAANLPPGAPDLASLITIAAALESELVQQRAAIAQRQKDLTELAHDIEAQTRQVTQQTQRLYSSQSALDVHCQRLHLPAGSAPAAVRAQLQALRHWTDAYAKHSEQMQQLSALQAHASALASDAVALGELLNEPAPALLDSWVDGLVQRLAQSRQTSALQATLRKTEATERQRQERAQATLSAAQQALADLCAQAQVAQAHDLPGAELRADQRRSAEQHWQDLSARLRKTSQQDADMLRTALAQQDSAALEQEKHSCSVRIEQLERDEKAANDAVYAAQQALAAIDTSDAAAQAREEMESAAARYRTGVRPWAQLKLAHALLSQALRRHRERAQGPVLALASDYFCQMTGGRFARLLVDAAGTTPLLLAQPQQGKPIAIAGLSEGTADQLHLALRLATLQVQHQSQPERQMPLVLDDVLMTADDSRAAHMLQALAQCAAQHQVLLFTHHQHLLEIAARSLPAAAVKVHVL